MQPDLENLKKRIGESRDLVDRVIAKLPGYTGYVERGEMYEADRVVRHFIGERLIEYKNGIMAVMSARSKRGELSVVAELDAVSTVIERVYKKVKSAHYGTSLTLSSVKVSQADLDRLLEHDWRMIARADELAPAIEKLGPAAPDAISAAVAEVRKQVEAFEKTFDERKNIILEVL